jgi:hypothetical protein
VTFALRRDEEPQKPARPRRRPKAQAPA